jgi:nicotinic acid phosphoribosyltransferase
MSNDILERLRDYDRHCSDADIDEAADEIFRLREAIRRLAEQDATLSVQGGNVTVTMDATLTDAEREAVEWAAFEFDGVRPDNGRAAQRAATLRGLLERLA